jgi:N-acyl-phosphatidylethanolamine-hydrolysing phospholipase D
MTATWLGHATMLVTIDNVTFITDPIWASHASPIWGFGPRRYRRPVCEIAELPQVFIDRLIYNWLSIQIHFGLISHNHYDHLDRKAVVDLQSRFVDMHWFVPLGLRQWMQSVGCVNVHEMNWCDRRSIKVTTNDGEKSLTICCLPVQHWSARAGYDRFKVSWTTNLAKLT